MQAALRQAWSVVSFFGLFAAVGAVLALVVTQGFALFSGTCALCRPSSGLFIGTVSGLLTAALQWGEHKRTLRG